MFPTRSRIGGNVSPVVLFAFALVLAYSSIARPASAQGGSPDGAWSQLDPTATAPSAHREYVSVYDQGNDRYIIFGGAGPAAPNPISLLNEVWTLSLGDAPAWSQLAVAQGPGPRHSPQSGYDPARHRLIIFGGYGCHHPGDPADYLNDVWELSLDGAPAWTELTPTGTPPSARLAGASVYDPIRQRLIVFGGTVGATCNTYALDLSGQGDPAWSVLSVSGQPPIAGYGMTTIYDPVRDRMLMFGGSTSDDYFGVHNDTWALTLDDAPAWTKLAPGGTPPSARRTLTSIYDPIRDRMITFAGWDNLSNNTSSFLNDTYALSLADNPTWAALAPSGGPPVGRDAIAAVYDAPQDRLVVYGGWSGLSMLADTWFLDWGSHGDDATLTPSAQAQPDVAQVNWDVAGATGSRVGVFRRALNGKWSSIATPQLDAQGHLGFADHAVSPGVHYDYQLAVASQVGEQFGGQIAVNVPSAVGVGDGPALQFALEPVRPNPIPSGRFAVEFTLARAGAARLALYDVSGRQVAAQEVGAMGPGAHTADFGGASRLAPGLYFVRLTAPGASLERRVVVSAN